MPRAERVLIWKMEDKVKVKIINRSGNDLPGYATAGSAGMDLRSWLSEPVTLAPGERRLIPTGLYVAIPEGYELQIRPRSGLALKKGISLVNTPGTIDSDYRGEIGVIMINHSDESFEVQSGDRICQAVLACVPRIVWEPVDELADSERGAGGFGHTGTI